MEIKKTITSFAFLMALFVNMQSVQALPPTLMFDSNNLVAGIFNLEVGSNFFDLKFENGSVDSLYPDYNFSPVTTAEFAKEVLLSMQGVLEIQLSNTSSYTSQIATCGDLFFDICNFNLAYAIEPGNDQRHLEQYINATGTTFGSILPFIQNNDYDTAINATETMVTLTAVSVPTPNVLILSLTAIISLSIQRGRKRKSRS